MKILVVGCGSIGRRHALNASRLAGTAIVDQDAERAAAVAGEIGGHWFSTIDDGLAWGPDGVVIATPNSSHAELAQMALASGADVLVEKPIANTVNGATAMLRTAAESERRIFVGCNMRFHPALQLLRDHLPSLGKLAFARAHFGNYLPNMRPGTDYRRNYSAVPEEGGIILDAIHELDYLIWLFGPVRAVCCEVGRLGDLDAPIEDYASLLMSHAHGVRSEIHVDYLQQFRRRGCEIVGTAGTMIWQAEGKQPERSSVRRYLAREGVWQDLLPKQDLQTEAPLRIVMERFANVLGGGDEPDLLDGTAALHDLQVALTAREAAANPAQSREVPG